MGPVVIGPVRSAYDVVQTLVPDEVRRQEFFIHQRFYGFAWARSDAKASSWNTFDKIHSACLLWHRLVGGLIARPLIQGNLQTFASFASSGQTTGRPYVYWKYF